MRLFAELLLLSQILTLPCKNQKKVQPSLCVRGWEKVCVCRRCLTSSNPTSTCVCVCLWGWGSCLTWRASQMTSACLLLVLCSQQRTETEFSLILSSWEKAIFRSSWRSCCCFSKSTYSNFSHCLCQVLVSVVSSPSSWSASPGPLSPLHSFALQSSEPVEGSGPAGFGVPWSAPGGVRVPHGAQIQERPCPEAENPPPGTVPAAASGRPLPNWGVPWGDLWGEDGKIQARSCCHSIFVCTEAQQGGSFCIIKTHWNMFTI